MNTLPQLLARLTRQKEALAALRPLSPEQEARIDQHFRLLLNYHSNRLEGNSLDFGETKNVVLHNKTAKNKPLRDHNEIIGHNEALKWIDELAGQERRLTESFIRELHQMTLQERFSKMKLSPEGIPTYTWVEVGEYKSKDNHVLTSTGEIFEFASVKDTPDRMRELVDWYNEEAATGELHPLLLAAQLHYRFVRIHPFDDGNGRVARLLLSVVLLRAGYSHLVVKTDTKTDYLTALEAYDNDQQDEFYHFLAAALVESMDLMLKGARGEPMEEEEDWKKRLRVIQRSMTEDPVPITARTDELLLARWKDTFYPLYKDLLTELSDFNDIYAHANHDDDTFANGLFPLLPGWRDNKKIISNFRSREEMINQKLRSAFSFQLRWEALKNSGSELFGNLISATFVCSDKYVYKLSSSIIDGYHVKKRYTEPMTVQERKDFVNTVAKQLVQLLDNQFQEIQRQATENL